MRIRGNESGAGKITVLFWLVLLALLIHVGYKIVPMQLDYERMKDEMNMKASMAQVMKDDEIILDLEKKARELDLPLSGDSFIINRDVERHRMTISAKWDVEVHFLFGVYIRTFHFTPFADEDFAKSRR